MLDFEKLEKKTSCGDDSNVVSMFCEGVDALTLCEDLEVFYRRGARFLLIRDYCGQVLKRRRSCKTHKSQLLPHIFSMYSLLL